MSIVIAVNTGRRAWGLLSLILAAALCAAGAGADKVVPIYTGDAQSVILGSWGDGKAVQGTTRYVNNPTLDITTSSFFAGGHLRLTEPQPLGVSLTKPEDTFVVLILRVQRGRMGGFARPGSLPGGAPGVGGDVMGGVTPPPGVMPGGDGMNPPETPPGDGAMAPPGVAPPLEFTNPGGGDGGGYAPGPEMPPPVYSDTDPRNPNIRPGRPGAPRSGRVGRRGAGFGRGAWGGGGWGGFGGGGWFGGRGASSFGVAFTSNQISQVRVLLLTDKGQIDSGALELNPNLNTSGDWLRLVVPFSQFVQAPNLAGAQLEGAVISGNTSGTLQVAQLYLKQENTPLVARIEGPRIRHAKVGEQLEFVSAPQKPGVKPSYQWSFDTLGGTRNPDALLPSATWSYAQAGDYLVTLQVSDAQHEQQADQILVIVE